MPQREAGIPSHSFTEPSAFCTDGFRSHVMLIKIIWKIFQIWIWFRDCVRCTVPSCQVRRGKLNLFQNLKKYLSKVYSWTLHDTDRHWAIVGNHENRSTIYGRLFQSSIPTKQLLGVESLLCQVKRKLWKERKNERAKRNKSQSGWGELVYSAISIKEIGLHSRCEWREVIDAKLG